jgi:hypothetical protein
MSELAMALTQTDHNGLFRKRASMVFTATALFTTVQRIKAAHIAETKPAKTKLTWTKIHSARWPSGILVNT